MKKLTFLIFAIIGIALTFSCVDETDNTNSMDGYIRFNMIANSDAGNMWSDGSRGTRAAAPIAASTDLSLDEPLYLHALITPGIDNNAQEKDTLPTTRGKRYTGHVFGNGINNFNIYGTIGGEEAFSLNTVINVSDMQGTDSDEEWLVNEGQEILTTWESNETGDFYGIAPALDPESVTCAYVLSDEPTVLNFTMQENERDNIDILTAKATDVIYDKKNTDGIVMEFKHILTAIKFKLNSADALTCTLNGMLYYINVKKVKLVNITTDGTFDLSTETWTQGSTIGDCTVDISRSRADMMVTGDDQYFVNTDDNCLMVMPQTTTSDTKLRMLCDLTTNPDPNGIGSKKENVVFDFPIGETTWEQCTTYTYSLKKLNYAVSYNFTSTYNNANLSGQTLVYPAEGGDLTLKVNSSKTITEAGLAPRTEAVPWHMEYYDGTTWQNGLPEGFSLLNNEGEVVPDIMNILGNDNDALYTWKLVATPIFPDELASTTVLKGNRYGGTSESDAVDLSLRDVSGNTLTHQTSANCYVVKGYGYFKFPLYYGNALKNGSSNNAAWSERTLNAVYFNYLDKHITNANIETDTGNKADKVIVGWEDTEEEEVIDRNSVRLKDEGGVTYVHFAINKDDIKAANALIAIKDNAERVMWSWHIWITDLDFSKTVRFKLQNGDYYNFMKHQLGWSTSEYHGTEAQSYMFRAAQNATAGGDNKDFNVEIPEAQIAVGGHLINYQFGRKDPFFVGKPEGIKGGTIESNLMFAPMNRKANTLLKFGRNNLTYTMADAIKNPTRFTYKGIYGWMIPHGFSEGASVTDWAFGTTWSPEMDRYCTRITKTVYDPCPVGYVTPSWLALRSLMKLPTNSSQTLMGSTTSNSTKTDKPVKYVQLVSSEGEGESTKLDVYLSGRLNANSSESKVMYQFNESGFLWSGITTFPIGAGYYFLPQNISTNTLSQSVAMAILPVKDELENTIETFSPIGMTMRCRIPQIPNTSGLLEYAFSRAALQYFIDNYGVSSITVTKLEAETKASNSRQATVKATVNCGNAGTKAITISYSNDTNDHLTEITLTEAQKRGLAQVILNSIDNTQNATEYVIYDGDNVTTNINRNHFYVTLTLN